MRSLFSQVALVEVNRVLLRNIVSIRRSQDLYDDLSDRPSDWSLAQRLEGDVKPPAYTSTCPAIDRPFEEATWFAAIGWPFRHWQASRYSDGTFGAWYGSDRLETTVRETAHHWYRGFLADAGFENERVTGERKVYDVACHAALLDLRPTVASHPALVHHSDYSYPQSVGARMHREGHPGLITPSVRHPKGDCYVVFNPRVLSNPRLRCPLTYRLENGTIYVERTPGRTWVRIPVEQI